MNCRDFLSEFEERNALSETATLHLTDCADCRKINVIQTRVWQTIETFEKVAAPNDFDFRVKARIADAKPDDFQSHSFPVLRYVLGLSVAVLILGFIVFNGFYSLDKKDVQVAKDNYQPSIGIVDPAVIPSSPKQITSTTVPQPLPDKNLITVVSKPKSAATTNKMQSKTFEGKTQFAALNPIKARRDKSTINSQRSFDGSQTNALSHLHVITPKGIPDSTKRVETLPNSDGANSITAEQILSQIGIETALENGKLKVKKISANSLAEHSGVQVGDVIETIDGEKLTNEPNRAKTIEGKTLTIMRGAEKKEISLHN